MAKQSDDQPTIIYSMMRVSKIYNNRTVIKDISLSYFYGAKIGVLGLNGSGKSTLLRIMAGIDTELVGEGFVAEGAKVGYLPQEPPLDATLNVRGNDQLIEYNEVCDAVKESDDQGAADMFGDATFRGNVYRYNYWHHIGNWRATGEQPKCGQAGIRLDDAISGTLIYGNVFEHCSTGEHGFGAVQIHGGKDNIVDNNLFVDCAAAMSFTFWDDRRWRNYVAPQMTNGEINAALYLQHYPALASLTENVNTNAAYRNVLIRCGDLIRGSTKTIAAFGNANLSNGDRSFRLENPLATPPGFAPIPLAEIGLYQDQLRLKK